MMHIIPIVDNIYIYTYIYIRIYASLNSGLWKLWARRPGHFASQIPVLQVEGIFFPPVSSLPILYVLYASYMA